MVIPSPPASASYLDITLDVMQDFGAVVSREQYERFTVSNRHPYTSRSYLIEGDYSSASYFFAIAAICGGRVTVSNLKADSVQGDRRFLDALSAMGCTVTTSADAVTVERSGDLTGISFDMSTSPDTVQTLCMVAAVAKTPTTITGISHLKFKESDRITGTAERLRALGGRVAVTDDAITITPGPAARRHHRSGKRSPHGHELCRAGPRYRGNYHHGCRMREQVLPRILGYAAARGGTGMRRIVFCGFRGPGRPRSGRSLQRNTALPFLDTDQLIEQKTGRSIPDIFHEDGEERFRAVEREVIGELPKSNAVISTGGGVVTDPANMEHLRRDSLMVLLHADLDTIEERLARNPRPPLTGLPLREEIAAMMERRRQHYQAAADFCIDTSGTTPAVAAAMVIRLLREGTVPAKERAEALRFFRTAGFPRNAWPGSNRSWVTTRQIPSRASWALPGIPVPTAGVRTSSMPCFWNTGSITITPGSRTRS